MRYSICTFAGFKHFITTQQVYGFGNMPLFCRPRKKPFTHRFPSTATPSFLTDPHPVHTEDDVLHIKNLPNFEDALGQRDSELLISYLTVPYLRLPLVLTFFSTEDRYLLGTSFFFSCSNLSSNLEFTPSRARSSGMSSTVFFLSQEGIYLPS